MYILQSRYKKTKSRHSLNLYLCNCNSIYLRRKEPNCRVCKQVDINFNILSCYKRLRDRYNLSAWKRQLSFNLSLNQFIILVNGNCFYCGAEKSNAQNYGKHILKYNGIDRVDNSIGYQPDNVVSCCRQCNQSKFTMNKEEFILWAKKVANHASKTS